MPKRRRPPNLEERTVQCGLKKALLYHNLLGGITDLVANVSRRTHRASLLLNYYFLCHMDLPRLEERAEALKDQMFYYAALTLSKSKNHPDLIDFYTKNAAMFDVVNSVSGCNSSVNAAARAMKTNVLNSLWMNFDCRVNRLTKEAGREAQDFVLRKIRNEECRKSIVLNRGETELVETCSAILRTNKVVNKAWIEKNPGRILLLYHRLQQLGEERQLRGFTILPVFQMKMHFTVIDAAALRKLLTQAGEIPSSLDQKDFNVIKDDYFRAVFKMRSPEAWTIGNEVKTDGTSLRINIWRENHSSVAESLLPRKKQKKDIPAQFSRGVQDDPNEDPALTNIFPGDESVYFSNDPGQANQAFVKLFDGGQCVLHKRLTWKQFKQESHLKKNLERVTRWNKEMQQEYAILSEHPLKTADPETFRKHLQSKIPLYARLWVHHLHSRMAKLRWNYQIHSRSCIDRFWSGLAYGNPAGLPLHRRPLLKYGSANWGHGSAPNQRMFNSAKNFFRIVKVPEFRTTVCCADCGSRMKGVSQRFNGPLQEDKKRFSKTFRGLKFCSSSTCRSTPLKSRDGNAATNIGLAFPNRPSYLCRD
mmetsp:Transcript_42774/g.76744  ORF Transcript_42774/g.76744 Transcript_42774/m.76744 type:complete len:590 (+) Transcript_42774:1588-3357(+)